MIDRKVKVNKVVHEMKDKHGRESFVEGDIWVPIFFTWNGLL